jgi:hypothetical protein
MCKTAGEEERTESPVELLCELFKTLLTSLRSQHPAEVSNFTQEAIIGCLEEYNDGMMVPLPILDEILICIGQGPTILVTVPAAVQPNQSSIDKRKPPAPVQVEQPNPSYLAAASIIRKSVDRLSSPIASLVNGLINGETHIVERSSIGAQEDQEGTDQQNQSGVDVWTIVYELSRVAPDILTTVLGNVSSCLSSPHLSRRQQVVKLLGKLFYARGSKLAKKFSPCYRQWLSRSNDSEWKIRLDMVHCLVSILKANPHPEPVEEALNTLTRIIQYDPKLDVRLAALHDVCDVCFEGAKDCPVSPGLLRAVGSRVQSKNKQERRDALTGLAQIYFRHFIRDKLKDINSAGDECDTDLILNVLSEHCTKASIFSKPGRKRQLSSANINMAEHRTLDQDKYEWIPSRVFECVFYSDANDPEMRSRVIQIVDDLLLGSELSKSRAKSLTPHARAVGHAIIVDSLRQDGGDVWGENDRSNAFKWMLGFFQQRAHIQKALSSYIDARANLRDCDPGKLFNSYDY